MGVPLGIQVYFDKKKAGRTIIAGHVVLVPLQIVGGRHMDRVTLALAREAERLFGGWHPPS